MNTVSLSLLMKQNNTFKNSLQTTEAELLKYIDEQDFVNLKPIIGLEGEKQIELIINGLQITFPEKIIFLGGYCSTFPSQTYTLNANKTNYIYLIRNNDRHVIDILNTETPIGSEANIVTFNRILTAKFITNTTTVTSMTYFQI